jgi:WD40 repeat protein
MKKTIIILLFLIVTPLYTQNVSDGHREGIYSTIINKGGNIITAGYDGFIVTWDAARRTAIERYQLSPYNIEDMAANPLNDDICIIENANISHYRISAWNYTNKTRLFLIDSNTKVTYINYSAGGNYIIVSGLNGSNLTLLNAQTGEIVKSPEISGPVMLGVTGRSERFMLLYQGGYDGQIHYVEMENFTITETYEAPGNLASHIIFGNNRFIAGVNSDGLHLIDAGSGALLDLVNYVERHSSLYPADDGFYCYSHNNRKLYRFTADRNGRLSRRQEITMPSNSNYSYTTFAYIGSLVFATTRGTLFSLNSQNRPVAFTQAQTTQTRMAEIAAGKTTIAVLTEAGGLFFIPADYSQFGGTGNIQIANKSGYSRITAIPDSDQFVLWQTANTRLHPLLIDAKGQQNERAMNYLTGRFPLRAVSFFKDKLLTLDTAGNISVRAISNTSARADYTFSSPGATDAAFTSDQYLVLCRGTVNNNSTFLFINYITGETVPVFYPAQGLSVYTGTSGTTYAETIEHEAGKDKTSIINLSAARNAQGRNASSRIFQYHEETTFVIAESAGHLATVRGKEDAFLISDRIINFQRTEALPVKITGHDNFFICFDSDGNITWHSNNSGELLAVFSLYGDRWTLKSDNEASGGVSQR